MYQDRSHAGKELATVLHGLAAESPIVLGLPRGGLPVAAEVARALGAPLDALVVRKVGAPMNPEFAIGAVGEASTVVIDDSAVAALGVRPEVLESMIATKQREVDERVRMFRGGRTLADVRDRTAVIVDDGLATGSTAAAAVGVVRALGAARIIVAVPVGSPEAVERLRTLADEVVCLETPEWFRAVGSHYVDFSQVSDSEVSEILAKSRPLMVDPIIRTSSGVLLHGDLTVPSNPQGIVLFAHGSGSSRLSPRNQFVARKLNGTGLATLLMDLLTPEEADDRRLVFDIDLLADRVVDAIHWIQSQFELSDLPIGVFGASTGAAAALAAAAREPVAVGAVVSRGGRPDLAMPILNTVVAPTLLIVGSLDTEVLALNREAAKELTCAHQLAIVPGATHLFEEGDTLNQAAELAAAWFHLRLAGLSVGPRMA